MKRKRYTEEQIAYALRQAEEAAGYSATEVGLLIQSNRGGRSAALLFDMPRSP